jgi:hypothetical protein
MILAIFLLLLNLQSSSKQIRRVSVLWHYAGTVKSSYLPHLNLIIPHLFL